MVKKLAVAAIALVAVAVAVLFFFSQAILAQDGVRAALAAQLSKAMGQPVTIGGINAAILPRVTVKLSDVAIGDPARITARNLDVGASVWALVSRRIEGARIHLSGARIELPLPGFGGETGAGGSGSAPSASEISSAGAPVEVVSVDTITLTDVEIVSGGRSLYGNVDATLDGSALTLRRLALTADDITLTATGTLTDVYAPAGEITITADQLNLDQLLTFANDFTAASGMASGSPAKGDRGRGSTSALDIAMSLSAKHATFGSLTMQELSGRARVTSAAVTLEPLAFQVFKGRYEGTIHIGLEEPAPTFRWNAKLTNVDVSAAAAFVGNVNTISGRLSGQLDLVGRGADPGSAIRTARGTARLDVVDGVVKNLGLVRTIVIATSMRASSSPTSPASAPTSTDEPFTRLGATLKIGGGRAVTDDLLFESQNLTLAAAGTLQLDGSDVNLSGKVQLTEALTKEAGTDLARYTQENGRVTLPASISGPATDLRVRIDVADMAKRAIINRAAEEAKSMMERLLKRNPQ